MQIKSFIIDNIHHINFIIYNISTLLGGVVFVFLFALLELGYIVYHHMSYMLSNIVVYNKVYNVEFSKTVELDD